MEGAIEMTMQGLSEAQGRYDAQEPPGEVECTFCEGVRSCRILKVQGCNDDVADWPEHLDIVADAPCPYCLEGRPLQRSRGDD